MRYEVQVRRSEKTAWGTLYEGHRSYQEASNSISGWIYNYPTFRDASFRVMRDGQEVHS